MFSLSSNISSKSEINSKNNSLPSECLTLHLQFISASQKVISLLLLIKFYASLSSFSEDFVKSKCRDLPFRVLRFLQSNVLWQKLVNLTITSWLLSLTRWALPNSASKIVTSASSNNLLTCFNTSLDISLFFPRFTYYPQA